MRYQKSQTGWILLLIFLPILVFLFLLYINQWGSNPLPLPMFVVMSVLFTFVLSLFYKLTVTLDQNTLKLAYGIGLIRIKLRIDELIETKIIKTPWYYGLGIRITPKGMLYNIQGSKAVALRYVSNGKSKFTMVGTPEPAKLKQVLDEHFMR